ncbi:MAG TPA: tannase/feruloyl esterase family alpha/beta hydrolase [Pyrinomonadaceae bacterium]|nr:tannase/feruloyl esterase family alpha/beta hydrolase [Pyrinomonadaceae bacterium]
MKPYWLATLALVPTIASAQTSTKCADLTNFKIPGATMVITKATVVPASSSAAAATAETSATSATIPSHCRVEGMINERTGADGRTYGIGFELALPNNWNNRFLFQGGGGYNGSVRPPVGAAAAGDVPGIARGFAVVSTDTGHKGATFDRTYDVDQQASIDFAQVAVDRVAVLSKQIIAHYYGQPAQYSYFAGCSTGGREGMLMTQRYPAEFDGVISGDPAMRTGFSQIGNNWSAVAFNQIAPKDDSGKPQPNKVFSESDIKLIVTGILNACDANDGLKDGMVFNTRACKFDPDVLVCKAGKNDSCLTPQQTAAIKKAFAGPHNSRGDLVYPMNGFDAGIANLLPSPKPPANPPTNAPPVSIDVDARLFSLLGNPLEAITDTTWTNLSTFSAHGGKLLFYHGMSDQAFSAMDTLDYYQRMAKANGGMDKVQNWSRMFLVPGMYHCRGGEFALDNFDLLTPLLNWVEKGTAPDSVVAKGKAFPGRTRPLCAYPKYAFYTGKGDPEDAKNFVCRE